jgi:hypothetical protein
LTFFITELHMDHSLNGTEKPANPLF